MTQMEAPRKPLERKIQRRFLPFAAVGLLAPLLAVLPPQPENWSLVWAASALTVAIAAVGIFVPWSRVPRWTYIIPPLAYFAVVALLRHGSEGAVSGYSPLALLPVVWIALNLGRKEVAIGIAAGASILVAPLVLDPAKYAAGDLRRAVLWSAVAAVVGFAVEALMRDKRRRARELAQQAAAIAAHEQTLMTIASVVRGITTSADTREEICRAACEVSGASMAAMVEPDGPEHLILTARAGPGPRQLRLRMDEPSGSTIAFRTGSRYFVSDAREDASIPQHLTRETGMVSGLFEPIQRGGETVGVLAVGWPHRIDGMGTQATEAVALLAAEAASAIERADLLAQLEERARTDELTGLPNRRTWDETARAAVHAAAASSRRLCVAVVDLDHFKAFNDRYGHQAGDRLLKAAAAAWRGALREGDTLARYGGEEFAVALPGCGLEEAERVLERLRGLTPQGLTCSIGLACWGGEETDYELLARADAALYEAKRAGRDALVVAAA
jgi:diguanylate cyclase (GGDEF)-like protein